MGIVVHVIVRLSSTLEHMLTVSSHTVVDPVHLGIILGELIIGHFRRKLTNFVSQPTKPMPENRMNVYSNFCIERLACSALRLCK